MKTNCYFRMQKKEDDVAKTKLYVCSDQVIDYNQNRLSILITFISFAANFILILGVTKKVVVMAVIFATLIWIIQYPSNWLDAKRKAFRKEVNEKKKKIRARDNTLRTGMAETHNPEPYVEEKIRTLSEIEATNDDFRKYWNALRVLLNITSELFTVGVLCAFILYNETMGMEKMRMYYIPLSMQLMQARNMLFQFNNLSLIMQRFERHGTQVFDLMVEAQKPENLKLKLL